MRIVLDMQGAQGSNRYRGIARYSISLAQALIRNAGEHEIILALSGLMPDSIAPLQSAFAGLLPADNIRVWHAPGPVAEVDPGNGARRREAELIRESFLASLQADVIHISSLFEGYHDDCVTSIGRVAQSAAISVTFYDLIPLLNPAQYFTAQPRFERHYRSKLEYLQQADNYLAISEFARTEALQHLPLEPATVSNISAAIDQQFRPLEPSTRNRQYIEGKYRLSRPFILYAGGGDERKNLPRLIQAYASLPPSLRAAQQLLLVGKLSAIQRDQLKLQAHSVGLQPDELLFGGYVSDADLVMLYNLCTLFVFPSWHEGFGLPALEAMACGAAVIGANSGSLPEVIGLDEALFNPMQPSAIAAKLQQCLTDTALRRRLQQHGPPRARLFSWDDCAQRALAAWEQLVPSYQVGSPHTLIDVLTAPRL